MASPCCRQYHCTAVMKACNSEPCIIRVCFVVASDIIRLFGVRIQWYGSEDKKKPQKPQILMQVCMSESMLYIIAMILTCMQCDFKCCSETGMLAFQALSRRSGIVFHLMLNCESWCLLPSFVAEQ
eukprot:1160719-Pelagomonas_calceolata.AAC.6